MEALVLPGVNTFGEFLSELLGRASDVKQTITVEPALNKLEFADIFERLDSTFFATAPTLELKKKSHPAIEAAIRDKFNNLLASTTIDTPSFVNVWNLLDIVSILSDDEQCDTALLFWLVEELLDSQTIAGCRSIFDYLEARREIITAKHFASKNLVILRSCNELLRRLSRADDTAFCGRVFIFMFQSFPLGDRSSVNLRGEYHTENVTSYGDLPPKEESLEHMDVDSRRIVPPVTLNGDAVESRSNEEHTLGPKGVTFSRPEASMSVEELYPLFWSLQASFNQPKKLFDSSTFQSFKLGLEATMKMFKKVQAEAGLRPVKMMDESKRGTKRKRTHGSEDLANAFNPKYLTSRDLFELEISDLSFRRHILVQVLIVLDFLLSLSTKAKQKLAKAMPENLNKSVMYADQSLSIDDTQWALDMKKSIAEYLKQGFEGAFFYRMVETVLSRDKNWVRWKIENCPSIARPSVTPQDYISAKAAARKATANRRIRPIPIGSLDLKFLSDGDDRSGLNRLKDPSRYQIPSIKSFKSKIELDDMDIDMARDDVEKRSAVESKASKSWRTLRIASTSKLAAFDKIDAADKINEVFQDDAKPPDPAANGDDEVLDPEDVTLPIDRRSIIISGPSGVGKGTLIDMLLERHRNVFSNVPTYTTRPPREDETEGHRYLFVSKQTFDALCDGDEMLEFNSFGGNDYGTSIKLVDDLVDKGKICVMEMDYYAKDKGFAARYIFVSPPDLVELERRLKVRGTDSWDKIRERLEISAKELQHSRLEGFHDTIIVNDDLQTSYEKLERYIFGDEDRPEPEPAPFLQCAAEVQGSIEVISTTRDVAEVAAGESVNEGLTGAEGDNATETTSLTTPAD